MRADVALIGDLLIDLVVDYTSFSDGVVDIDHIYIAQATSPRPVAVKHEIQLDFFNEHQRGYILEGCRIDAKEKGLIK